eukprot:TRINITY_DN76678_c0_g1_i1.p1 TRINITY_DN76678_c0_g1~~TRINITY_DN76678_c0_g1_i1.p1  ORF type:complete len:381 (-),score=54.70 TRINITY_DN76678_c0_g1_i1:176-1318(-)
MRVGQWSGGGGGQECWTEPIVVSRDVSPSAFMEELCSAFGGYDKLFWTLIRHYIGWWGAVVAVPAAFLDHHRCEARLPYLAWVMYSSTLAAIVAFAVLLELSVVQQLGLLRKGDLASLFSERRWQIPLLSTVLWKLDSYTDVVFIFIAKDCGSSLWWASLATFIFGVVFGQLFFNTCFACTDCDRELPSSFGFMLLDFKLVNTAVRHVLPFDPDASTTPMGRPVTLKSAANLISFEKVIGTIAQVSIQSMFLKNAKGPQIFVMFSILCGVLHAALSLFLAARECVQDDLMMNAHGLQMGTALLPDTQLASSTYSLELEGLPSIYHKGPTTMAMDMELGRSCADPASGGDSSGAPRLVEPSPTGYGNPSINCDDAFDDLLM